jgi:L-rhamnose-H+ transport protein
MLVAFGFATLIFPLIFVSIFVPTWAQALGMVDGMTIFQVMIWGACWGLGGVFMALAVASIGMSIPYATVMGISTVVGSMIPLTRRWSEIPGLVKVWTFIGIIVTIIGVSLCGRGGYLREKGVGEKTPEGLKKLNVFVVGLLFCVISGFLSAGANIGFDTGQPIADNAIELLKGKLAVESLGYRQPLCSLAAWMPMWWGGYIAMIFVFGTKLIKNKTLVNYTGPKAGRDLTLAISMGFLHYLAQAPYGVGAYFLGKLGTTVGWAVTIASSLIVANLLGAITGEWKQASKSAKNTLIVGLVVLIVAMCVLAYANSLL